MEITKLGQKVEYSSQYDPSQLEFIPRATRRVGYTAPMFGGDIWTCYEVSFLKPNGAPEYHVLRLFNPADSEFIFESKSLKLYLNSFNNTKFESLDHVLDTIQEDLSRGVSKIVSICKMDGFSIKDDNIQNIDYLASDLVIDTYNYTPTLLKASVTGWSNERFSSNLLRSNCEVTGQPDFASISVKYTGSKGLDIYSFLKYIISFRNHQEFHEPTCERIYNDLYNLLEPTFLEIICQYTRRGGIDINPIRSTTSTYSYRDELEKLPKKLQQ